MGKETWDRHYRVTGQEVIPMILISDKAQQAGKHTEKEQYWKSIGTAKSILSSESASFISSDSPLRNTLHCRQDLSKTRNRK